MSQCPEGLGRCPTVHGVPHKGCLHTRGCDEGTGNQSELREFDDANEASPKEMNVISDTGIDLLIEDYWRYSD